MAPNKSIISRGLLLIVAGVCVAAIAAQTCFSRLDLPGFPRISLGDVKHRETLDNIAASEVAATAMTSAMILGIAVVLGLSALTRPALVDLVEEDEEGSGAATSDTVEFARLGRDYLLAVGLPLILTRLLAIFDSVSSFAIVRVDGGPAQFLAHSALLALRESGANLTGHPFWDTPLIPATAADWLLVYYIHFTVKDSLAFRHRSNLLAKLSHSTVACSVVALVAVRLVGYFRLIGKPLLASVFASVNVLCYTLAMCIPLWMLWKGWQSARSEAEENPRTATVVKHACESMAIIFVFSNVLNMLLSVSLLPGTEEVTRFAYSLIATAGLLCKGVLPGAHFLMLAAVAALADVEVARRAERHEAAERVQGQALLVRYICHEVRVPLQTVIAGVSMVAEHIGCLDDLGKLRLHQGPTSEHPSRAGMWLAPHAIDDAFEGLRSMQRSCKSVRRILDDVLTLEKIGQGGLKLIHSQLNVVDTAEAIAAAMSPLALQKDISLVVSASFASNWARRASRGAEGDEDRIELVVRNFVSNALKFTGERGRITIGVHCSASVQSPPNMAPVVKGLHPIAEAGGSGVLWALFTVTDSGGGIEEEDFERLFKPFHQLASGARFKETSTGLGLSICRNIVALHGGTIGAWSDGRGRGATFWAQFPLRVLDEESDNDSLLDPGFMGNHSPRLDAGGVNESLGVLPHVVPDGEGTGESDKDDLGSPLPLAGNGLQSEAGVANALLAPPAGRQLPPVTVRHVGQNFSSMMDTASVSETNAHKDAAKSLGAMVLPIHGPPSFRSSASPPAHAYSKTESSRARRHPEAASHQSSTGDTQSDGSNHTAGSGRPLVILVVDDTLTIRTFFSRILRRQGFEVREAENGLEGVKATAEIESKLVESRDSRRLVVLMDGTMPVMGGQEATRRIKQAHGDRVTVVAVTGNARDEDKADFLRSGAREVVAKPVTPAQLRAFLSDIEHGLPPRASSGSLLVAACLERDAASEASKQTGAPASASVTPAPLTTAEASAANSSQ